MSLKEIMKKQINEHRINKDTILALNNNLEAAELCNNIIMKNRMCITIMYKFLY